MTEAQREAWYKWGKTYLMKKFKVYAARAEKEMQWFGLQWGLQIQEHEQDNAN